MCGSLDDCDSFSDLLSDSDDDFNLSAGSPPTQSTSQDPSEFQLGPAMYGEINGYMLNVDDSDTDCFSETKLEWECGSASFEPRSRTTDATATVVLEQDTTMCVPSNGEAVSSAHCIGKFSIAYTPTGHQSHARSTH